MDKNLLIISPESEENSSIQKSIKDFFLNVNIIIANNLNDIFNYIDAKSIDLIIFDVDFPNLFIENKLGILKQIISYKRLPIIVISNESEYKRFFDAGAINFIPKPFSEISIISNITTAVQLINNYKAIEKQENEIEEKNKRIQFQIENEIKQRDIIIKKNKEIMADIRYASRIQQALLPKIEFINENIDEYFILHQPKSHVSGDFYWVHTQGNIKIIAVGDCTGHGISGALMHMLGAVYLNEIVTRNNYKSASDILEQLRDYIMKSLNQTGKSGETQDGLDIALCLINCKTKELQFTGANNPVYIIRNNELIEIKGDRMPVGIHINFNKPFTNNLFKLKSSDQLYLFSDGYADQFGGPNGKKFRYKQFKELLINNSHEPMNIQKEILNNIHDKWRGSLDQIDDILVFGIKIK